MGFKVRTLLRVSSRQQLQDDDIPLQRAELKTFIEQHKEWIYDGEYIEAAVSAYKNSLNQREKLLQILEDAKNGQFDILLAYMSDRIGRKDEYTAYISALNNLGIQVWTVKEGQLKTDSHMDALINYIRFWQNEGESRKTSARVRDALAERAREGKFNGGIAPFGYKLVATDEINKKGRIVHKLQIVEKDAQTVRKIYSYAVNQGYGYQRIANALNESGIKSPTGKKWGCSTLYSILTNPIYMGYVSFNRRKDKVSVISEKQVDDYIIIEAELWHKAQKIRQARKEKINSVHNKNTENWQEKYGCPFSTKGQLVLIGIVYCACCGKPLKNKSYCNRWTQKKTGKEIVKFCGRYSCESNHQGRHSYSQDYIEGIIFEVIDKYIENMFWLSIEKDLQKIYDLQILQQENVLKNIILKQEKIAGEISALEKYIPKALTEQSPFQLEKLAQMLSDREKIFEQLKADEKAETNKMKNLQADKLALADQFEVVPQWKQVFENADISSKHMLISTIIDRIEVADKEFKIVFRISEEEFNGCKQ